MKRCLSRFQRWLLPTVVLGAWLASVPVWAQEAAGESQGGTPASTAYVIPYTAVILAIAISVFLVARPSRREDKRKVEFGGPLIPGQKGPKGTPIVSLGMSMEQVNGMLGRPKVSRRGSEIFAELAAQGKLSEEEAAKEYCIYQHPAGRYELVFYERRVVQIRAAPKPAPAEH
jgi:hypothetical protein